MSATGHERRRRAEGARLVLDNLRDEDIAEFIRQRNLPCASTREALAEFLPTYDRVTLDVVLDEIRERKPRKPAEPKTFDLAGDWFTNRAKVRDLLGAYRSPQNKKEAREWLVEAGYEVVNAGSGTRESSA